MTSYASNVRLGQYLVWQLYNNKKGGGNRGGGGVGGKIGRRREGKKGIRGRGKPLINHGGGAVAGVPVV